MAGIITLTTDFGLADEYVGVMKGVILTRAPGTIIVDLSHAVTRQNVRQAAVLVASAYRYFPPGTIHLVVVDPGVGTSRRLVLLQADEHLFLAPDNGVLSFLLESDHFQAAHEVRCEEYYLPPVSSTFHGRDILAPVAAALVAGLDPGAVGPKIAAENLRRLESAQAETDSDRKTIRGEIISIDHFGNLLTNISSGSLQDLYGKEISKAYVSLRGVKIAGITNTYGDRAPGQILALVGSRGYLEISVNQGDAAALLGAEIADEVKVAMDGE